MSRNDSLALDLKILARTPLAVLSHPERRTDARALFPFPPHMKRPPSPCRQAANDSYGEVMVGGLTTACLYARRPGPHDAAGLPGRARAIRTASPSWSSPPTAMPSPWPPRTQLSALTFEQADIIHADGQAAVFASRLTTTPDPRAQRHHRFHP